MVGEAHGETRRAGWQGPSGDNRLEHTILATGVEARDWLQVLARYREPDLARSLIEIAITLAAFVALWVLAWASLSIGYWLTLFLVVPTAGFLVRLFLIQHDCGHGAFFRKRLSNDWVGRAIGVLTLTPYDVWRRSHAIHHATSGNLDHRGIGDIDTLTVSEYRALSFMGRLRYRLYREPLVMFGIGPSYVFMLRHRLPFGFMHAGWRPWVSAMGTNAGIVAVSAGVVALVGLGPFLMVQLPVTALAGSIGVWLFYVQHQFEETVWAPAEGWNQHEAALYGSSHYDLPQPLKWMSANIGIHHVHHLYSRIPFYRLPQVLRDFPELAGIHRLTLRESLACVRYKLWDEARQRMVTFREARVA